MTGDIYRDWLSTRPDSIQRLAQEFPFAQRLVAPGGDLLYVLGYREDDTIILTTIDPSEDYDEANRQHFYVCAQHIREITVSEDVL